MGASAPLRTERKKASAVPIAVAAPSAASKAPTDVGFDTTPDAEGVLDRVWKLRMTILRSRAFAQGTGDERRAAVVARKQLARVKRQAFRTAKFVARRTMR